MPLCHKTPSEYTFVILHSQFQAIFAELSCLIMLLSSILTQCIFQILKGDFSDSSIHKRHYFKVTEFQIHTNGDTYLPWKDLNSHHSEQQNCCHGSQSNRFCHFWVQMADPPEIYCTWHTWSRIHANASPCMIGPAIKGENY